MNKIIISPSILSADFAYLARDMKKVEDAGADWIHIDVMDGHFVPNITIGAPVVKALKPCTRLPLDVHLMISDPEKYLDDFINAKSDIITFHIEAAKGRTSELIAKIKANKIKAGVSIKPKTKAEEVLPYLDKLDMILVMSVEPGFGGQSFMPEALDKIKFIRESTPNKNLIIQVDGGINELTGKHCIEHGANSLVAGSYIYNAPDIPKAIKALNQQEN